MNQLTLEAVNNPKTVVPGEKTTITVLVRDEGRIAVPRAQVTITAGGGRFLEENKPERLPTSTGLTDPEGRFVTEWVELVSPAALGYEMDIVATKAGFTSGKTGLLIKVTS
jgi:hypothetical protein